MHVHGHFKCVNCKKVFDIPVTIDQLVVGDMKDFKIDEYHVYFKGTCPQCQNK